MDGRLGFTFLGDSYELRHKFDWGESTIRLVRRKPHQEGIVATGAEVKVDRDGLVRDDGRGVFDRQGAGAGFLRDAGEGGRLIAEGWL